MPKWPTGTALIISLDTEGLLIRDYRNWELVKLIKSGDEYPELLGFLSRYLSSPPPEPPEHPAEPTRVHRPETDLYGLLEGL